MNRKPFVAVSATPIAAVLVVASFCVFLASTPARAQDSTSQSVEASQASLAASGMIVEGSADIIKAGGELVVAAIRPVANASVIVLRDAATGSEASVRVVGNVASAASLAVGQTVRIVAEAAGYSLLAAGKLVVFIPNQVGHALIYQAPSTQN